jgi:hypothetical protein
MGSLSSKRSENLKLWHLQAQSQEMSIALGSNLNHPLCLPTHRCRQPVTAALTEDSQKKLQEAVAIGVDYIKHSLFRC